LKSYELTIVLTRHNRLAGYDSVDDGYSFIQWKKVINIIENIDAVFAHIQFVRGAANVISNIDALVLIIN